MARIAFWRWDDSEAVQARRRKSWGTPEARSSAIGQCDVLSAWPAWLVTRGGYLVATWRPHKMPRIGFFRGDDSSVVLAGLRPSQATPGGLGRVLWPLA
ncbi:MAG: hypothetical protein KatS3mg038_1749 [Candidatus Kapaibacterium sp.]|nr:MAG: hypothetical protein KatS3mg038_1749 [Candidatus Kapabacteria bacterium]